MVLCHSINTSSVVAKLKPYLMQRNLFELFYSQMINPMEFPLPNFQCSGLGSSFEFLDHTSNVILNIFKVVNFEYNSNFIAV